MLVACFQLFSCFVLEKVFFFFLGGVGFVGSSFFVVGGFGCFLAGSICRVYLRSGFNSREYVLTQQSTSTRVPSSFMMTNILSLLVTLKNAYNKLQITNCSSLKLQNHMIPNTYIILALFVPVYCILLFVGSSKHAYERRG